MKRALALLFAGAVLALAFAVAHVVEANRARDGSARGGARRGVERHAGRRRADDARARAEAGGAERGLQPAPRRGAARKRRRRHAAGSVSHRGLVGALPERVQGLRRRLRGRQAGRHRGDEERRLRLRPPHPPGARGARGGRRRS